MCVGMCMEEMLVRKRVVLPIARMYPWQLYCTMATETWDAYHERNARPSL